MSADKGSRLRDRVVEVLDRYERSMPNPGVLYDEIRKAVSDTTCARCSAVCPEGRIALEFPRPRSSAHGVTLCSGCSDSLLEWWATP